MTATFESLEPRTLWCVAGAEAPHASAALRQESVTLVAGAPQTDDWVTWPALPAALGEVSAGLIGDNLYVVGEGNPATYVYALTPPPGVWSTAAARPHPGNHHAAEVVNGRLYLFGGLTRGSEGEVQVFDPATGAWTKGADMPFAAGSSSSALIGGMVYVAGGIVGGTATTDRVARYDPTTDTWAEMAPMRHGRNHAASGTDGQKLYVFGGRGPGSGDANVLENGFDTVQVYDPLTNTWQSSDDLNAVLAPLPRARGGMGKAAFAFGEFYVLGGETRNGPGATADGVYDRVDVCDVATNSWRLAPPMEVPRHGIFPVVREQVADGRVYRTVWVAGGGVRAAGSQSTVFDSFTVSRPLTPPPPPPPPTDPAAVAARYVFYNNSAFDGNDPAATPADDAAIATDKLALAAPPPGSLAPVQPASFANYTSYSRGINGVMVDVANLPAALTASDFVFQAGNDASPAAWPAAPAPAVTQRAGAGINGSTRVTLTWPDGQLQKTWLRITVLPTPNTGLAAPDLFYFGNWPGETGNRPNDTRVNKADAELTRRNRTRRNTPPPAITSRFDFDRNGVVNVLDRRVIAAARTKKRVFLALIAGQ